MANLLVWPSLFERRRGIVLEAGLLSCSSKGGGVTHVVAEAPDDLIPWLQ
ncbi:hypothetical protein [Methylobacterium indicum]|uniref:Uncharacterized protein n=1 Tax=Methylobacterium indicum TaxID=1775910 RepID=A0A8H8WXP3_9HYPH|nr:hypothetical protein [Methylobacterium indicum]BCM86324.1 hypothetical protein mvi_47850 [Methylobacterium indicum]